MPSNKLKVAILGSGNIGTDLLIKTLRSPHLQCTLFVGRNMDSQGIRRARELGVRVSDQSIKAIQDDPDCCDLVFDATSAQDHFFHAPILRSLGKVVIDMTPSKVGEMCVPAVNLQDALGYHNVNMVTCGGQASTPLAHAIGQVHPSIDYIEVVSSIASRSAGPATRANLDEYIETTEEAIRFFSGCKRSKAILNVNPAVPCIDMQTTVFAKIANPNMDALTREVKRMVQRIRWYVPGYQLIVPPMIEHDRVVMIVRVQGQGDYLPPYAGNLDIINCAAIATAEEYARALAKKGA